MGGFRTISWDAAYVISGMILTDILPNEMQYIYKRRYENLLTLAQVHKQILLAKEIYRLIEPWLSRKFR